MAPRPLLLVLLAALFIGCAPASNRMRAAPARPLDPDRWARAACLRDEYPLELDGRAYATARQEDLTAERQGLPSPSATARLLEDRAAFRARCATWREQASAVPLASNERSGR